MKTVLVTGGAGFIGSHICDYLLAKGNRVICVDNLSTGSEKNISHLLGNKNFSFIRQNITKPLEVEGSISEIYNLACPASPVDYANLPIETMLVSSLGVNSALELAVEKKARFLQASTSEVYGNPLEHPQKESYWGNVNPVGPRSCYDEGKRFAEALVMSYHRKNGVDTRIVRIFNTYGPRMRANDGRVMPNFITNALKGKPIELYGGGKQTRSFCFVSDLVEGIYLLMQSDYCQPVNMGNPEEMTVEALARRIIILTGSKSSLVSKSLPIDDPERRKPDISVAKKILDWEPKVGLESGLKETIDYFKTCL